MNPEKIPSDPYEILLHPAITVRELEFQIAIAEINILREEIYKQIINKNKLLAIDT